jgi:pimeloyl-ACP methyl ester carboxylesterase
VNQDLQPQPFVVDGRLRGETLGEGPPVVLCHGITATRNQVVHGSKALARAGYRMIIYDARGHGESEPAPRDSGYGGPQNVEDLRLVVSEQVGDRPFVLGGHSMGSHTATAYAIESPEQLAGLVVIGPVYSGRIADAEERERVLGRWDEMADGLEQGGVEGFLEVIDRQGLDPSWRETVLRFTRERMEKHRHPEAVAQAMRAVVRSPPFDSLDELDFVDVPALVVASHDVADPGHPYAVAEAYAQHLPRSRLISEAEGESPLAWQGGTISREIAAFCAEPAVAERLGPVS